MRDNIDPKKEFVYDLGYKEGYVDGLNEGLKIASDVRKKYSFWQ